MFHFRTTRGEPRSKRETFLQAYAQAQAEARATGYEVTFEGPRGTYIVPESGNGWFLIRRAA